MAIAAALLIYGLHGIQVGNLVFSRWDITIHFYGVSIYLIFTAILLVDTAVILNVVRDFKGEEKIHNHEVRTYLFFVGALFLMIVAIVIPNKNPAMVKQDNEGYKIANILLGKRTDLKIQNVWYRPNRVSFTYKEIMIIHDLDKYGRSLFRYFQNRACLVFKKNEIYPISNVIGVMVVTGDGVFVINQTIELDKCKRL